MKHYTVSVMQDKWRFVGGSANREGLLELIERIPNELTIRIHFGVPNRDFMSSIMFDGSMKPRKEK